MTVIPPQRRIKPWNSLHGMGFVASDPQVIESKSGGPQSAAFRMCLALGAQTEDGGHRPSFFITITVWPPSHVHILNTVRKGMTLFVEGDLRSRKDKEGRPFLVLNLQRYRTVADPNPLAKGTDPGDPKQWPDVVTPEHEQNVALERKEQSIQDGGHE